MLLYSWAFTFAMSRPNAVLVAFSRLNPKTVVFISPAIKKNVHPAAGISFSKVERALLTAAHPLEWGFRCSTVRFGNRPSSFTKMSPASIVCVMVALVEVTCRQVRSAPLHGRAILQDGCGCCHHAR